MKSKDFTMVKQALMKHKGHEGTKNRGEESINKLMMDCNRVDL